MRQRRARAVLILTAILAVAALLRFAGLASKPLWLDEAMTALLCLGRGPDDVPLGVALPLSRVSSIFTVHPTATWRDIVTRLVNPTIEHTHPPLFYVISHWWLSWWQPSLEELAWALRAVAAAFGVVAVALTFGLARAAFDDRVAHISAAVAAVSPLMVMLAQEARNYTLPLALITAALWVMVAIVNRLPRPAPPAFWALWASLNALACYAHYYGVLAFAAEAAMLGLLTVRARGWRQLGPLVASAAVGGLAFLPWAAVLLTHAVSPEQRWMRLREPFAVFHNTLNAWQSMILGVKWEGPSIPPLLGAASMAVALVVALWVLVAGSLGLARRLRAEPRPAALALLLVFALTLGQAFGFSFLYDKDFLSQGRYHFVYYPAMVTLFGWVLAALPSRAAVSWRETLVRPARRAALVAILLLGALNSLLTAVGLEFPKGFKPDLVGAALAEATPTPVLVATGTGSFHETVIYLTYAIELLRHSPEVEQTWLALVPRGNRYATPGRHFDPAIFWTGFASIRGIAGPPSTVWVDGVRLWPWEYPPSINVQADDGARRSCTIDPQELTRLDDDDNTDPSWRSPFRLYHCRPAGAASS